MSVGLRTAAGICLARSTAAAWCCRRGISGGGRCTLPLTLGQGRCAVARRRRLPIVDGAVAGAQFLFWLVIILCPPNTTPLCQLATTHHSHTLLLGHDAKKRGSQPTLCLIPHTLRRNYFGGRQDACLLCQSGVVSSTESVLHMLGHPTTGQHAAGVVGQLQGASHCRPASASGCRPRPRRRSRRCQKGNAARTEGLPSAPRMLGRPPGIMGRGDKELW